jgi:hypothetical protein
MRSSGSPATFQGANDSSHPLFQHLRDHELSLRREAEAKLDAQWAQARRPGSPDRARSPGRARSPDQSPRPPHPAGQRVVAGSPQQWYTLHPQPQPQPQPPVQAWQHQQSPGQARPQSSQMKVHVQVQPSPRGMPPPPQQQPPHQQQRAQQQSQPFRPQQQPNHQQQQAVQSQPPPPPGGPLAAASPFNRRGMMTSHVLQTPTTTIKRVGGPGGHQQFRPPLPPQPQFQ